MDTLVITDNETTLIDPYWLEVILAETKTYFTKQELEDDELDDLYILFEDCAKMYLTFKSQYIGRAQFDIFYQYCLQACHSFSNSDDAKAYYVDWKKGTWRTRDSNGTLLSDYLNPTIKEQLLTLGNTEGYFDNTEEKKKDFQNYVELVLLWWDRFLKFLKENYGKPKQEQNN